MMSKDHYIPQFYLKKWYDTNREISVCKYQAFRGEFLWSKKTSAKICYKKDLYGFNENDYFKPLDTDANLFVERLEKISIQTPTMVTMNEEQRIKWIHFILALIYRSPQNIEHIANAFRIHGLKKIESIAQIPGLINDGNAIESIKSMRWVFANIPSDQELITGDNPLVFLEANEHVDVDQIALPLGPHQCFLAFHPKKTDKQTLSANTLVNLINIQILINCSEQIYARSPESISDDFIRQHWRNP